VSTENHTLYPGNDRTIVIPRPGGRGFSPSPPSPPPQQPPSYYAQPEPYPLPPSGVNSLVSAASSLLALTHQLRNTLSHGDITALHNRLSERIREFENQARMLGNDPDTIQKSSYVLCSLIDETILNTVWGSNSFWGRQPLLSVFHNETSGGENFFIILDQLLRNPNADLNLIELLFVCLSLGFKGQYSVIEQGQEKLESLRSAVFETIRRRRGEFPRELSRNWQGSSEQRSALRRHVPLWVVAAVAGVLLLSVFIGFNMVLEETANPVYDALQGMGETTTDDLLLEK